jgi:16S rRNA (cytosine967-C5)-methyltransferase
MSTANPGRIAAVRALVAVEEGAHAEDVLVDLAPPTGSDRGLAWHLTQGAFRRLGAIDAGLRPFLRRDLDTLDPIVRAILRMAMVDAHLSRTPHRAAVHQAVEVCRAVGHPRATGFVNAVLRRGVGQPLDDDPWLDLPPWLAKRWAGHDEWVRRLRDPAPLCISSKGEVPAELNAVPASIGATAVPNAWVLPDAAGRIEDMPGFAEGSWWVMDTAAAAVADLVLQHTDDGGAVLDACAAPGGKCFRLCAAGRVVTGVDQSALRIGLLEDGLQRMGWTARTAMHKWGAGTLDDVGHFDAVLVDAPCTGLGTVRRHPEIRWRRSPADAAAMGIRQTGILRAAAAHVGPSGVLIYAVCSPEPEEGPEVVARLDGWKVVDTWASVPPVGDEDAHQAFVLRREDTQA